MVGGFLTTLIALEKTIPLKRTGLLIIPLLSALTLLMAVNGCYYVGLAFLLAGSIGLFCVQGFYFIRYPHERSIILMLIGACCLVMGNTMLIRNQFYPAAFPWWMGFVLFTIVGERMELSKFLPVSNRAKAILMTLLAFFPLGVLLPFHHTGKYFSGIALIGISVWMMRNDVIQIGLRKEGLVKYSSFALLLANSFLLLEGIFLVVLPNTLYAYDILVHVFFVGYGITMIFAHGPIILPAVLGLKDKPYHPALYVCVILLHSSLLFRIVADSLMLNQGRKYSGAITGIAILLYFITLIVRVVYQRNYVSAR